jgi:AraC-like DNA-binding protein
MSAITMSAITMNVAQEGKQAFAVGQAAFAAFRNGVSELDYSDVMCEDGNEADTACKIEQSIAYMKQNLDKPMHVATLAGHVNVSPSHYFALFKRHTGSAPIDYFTRLRMRRACLLLDSSMLSIKEIASALGYDDPFYFSRVFKSTNLLSPSDFRKAHRNGNHNGNGNESPRNVENQAGGNNGHGRAAGSAAKNGQSNGIKITQGEGRQAGSWKASSVAILSCVNSSE